MKAACFLLCSGITRYDFKHEILANAESTFRGSSVPRTDRRISLICRERANEDHEKTLEYKSL